MNKAILLFTSSIVLLSSIKLVASGGGGFCSQYTSSILSIHQGFDIASKLLKENSFAMLEKVFHNNTTPVEVKQQKITAILVQAKPIFDNLESEAYRDLGHLIGKDPQIIATKLFHAFDVTDFPFVCVMKDANYISVNSNTIQKSVTDYANKIFAEL